MTSDIQYAIDPVLWARDCLNIIPDTWQEGALRSASKRLILNCSRQSGKSTTASILALHRAMYYPKSLILLISPSLRQSGELFRKVTDHLNLLIAKPVKTEDNRLSLTLLNGSRIVSLPSSEATIRGFSGASLIIEDEAARVSDELYYAIRPMLATSGGRFILMSTPFGKRGHFYEAWENGGDLWERITIPASACPRISKEFLAEERATLGDWWFTQEYDCRFVQTTDQVFDYKAVMQALSTDVKPLFEESLL
jgi:hypothetical protein